MVHGVRRICLSVRKEDGKGFCFKEGASRARVLVALMFTIVIAFVVSRSWHGPALIAALFVAVISFGAYIRSRLGGLTGDSYGAVNAVAEVLTLLVLPLIWRT